MLQEFSYPGARHQAEVEVKRSRFIACVGCAREPQEALQFIAQIRSAHPQARHVCSAYIAGPPYTTMRSMSDDGEPSGTAGRPMLAVLEHCGWGEIVVAVARYFGGIKLGMGGLQRAYSDSVVAALNSCPSKTRRNMLLGEIKVAFSDESAARHLVDQFQGGVINSEYGAAVVLALEIPALELEDFLRALANVTAGRAICSFKPQAGSNG